MREFYEKMFKKEIEQPVEEKDAHYAAFFSRLDVDGFFQSLSNYYNPSDLIRKLGGVENFYKLKKDVDIFAAWDKRIAAVLDTRMNIDGEDKELVKIFEEELKPHERQLKLDFMDTQFNGYGVEQIIYNKDSSGKIDGFQKEEFWRFEPLPDLIHVVLRQTSNQQWANKVMPYGKWILTTNNGSYYNPTGEPLAEKLIMSWIFKCNGWDIWIDFAKRFSNGFMHGKIEDGSKKDEFRRTLEKAGKSAVLVTDKNTELNLIQANKDSSIYNALIDKTISSINKAVLGETLTTNVGANGSYAAASVHNDVRLEKTMSDISLMEFAFNSIIEQAAAVKGFDGRSLPKVTFTYETGLNAELATRDASLKAAGVKFNKKYYVKNYGLKEDEFEVEVVEASPFSFNANKNKRTFLKPEDVNTFLGYKKPCGHRSLNLSDDSKINRKINKSFNEKEELVQTLNRLTDSPISTEDLIAAINVSKNSKELDENLALLFDQKNNSFIDVLTEALYNAAAKGALQGNPEIIKKEDQV